MYFARLALFINLAVARTRPTIQHLKQVVTTTQKIWVRWMSYEQHTHTYIHKCIYDEFRPYNYSYLLLHHYEVGGTWQNRRYFASLMNGGRRHDVPIMRVSARQGGVGVDHALKFWDRYNHCAVFVLVHHGKPECEIYVWEDHIAFNVTRCEDVYKQYCPRWHYAPFSRHCRP
uniref:Lipocalin n=1 Tax=Rhipicephalus zambeziensis TaxID=60191 RepID=A0A224YNK5_9ACAR